MNAIEAAYERPVKATLMVELENGETFPATAADLEKFGLVRRVDAYYLFDQTLRKAVGRENITDSPLNPVRYLVETAVCFPDLIDHQEHRDWAAVAVLDRFLESHDAEVERQLAQVEAGESR